MSTAVPAVHIEALRFRWQPRQRWALEVPSLSVECGERVFVAGPSGSGKTSLLSLVSGIVVPEAGDVAVLGTSLRSLGGAARDRFRAAHIGLIFQLFNLLPFLSVLDNVLLGCHYAAARAQRATARSGSPRAEALRLLTSLGLDATTCSRAVGALSVGQQQRVAAARALIGAPPLVLADEPTSALDDDNTDDFMRLLLQETAAVGSALLFVSHDRRLAAHFGRSIDLRAFAGGAP